MTYTDKHIINTYSELFEGLSSDSKMELLENLSKSIKSDNKRKDKSFYNSFGGFESDKSAEQIITQIRSARTFRDKEIKLLCNT